jgi:hypothetical protein
MRERNRVARPGTDWRHRIRRLARGIEGDLLWNIAMMGRRRLLGMDCGHYLKKVTGWLSQRRSINGAGSEIWR